ncbi:sigma-70 family RNA polymerase sigma factor [Rhodanobacter sp. FDAARGOS 1247]|uniref:RNA polymerase sigma factor n=1 Tax=Rhodanobacter sp. FDAARGOS 1247 TaxID=2778082 RepID=UPI0019524B71|nr:sigma-70 family RNA polymerase sigma factor [Rhodanobacter sp. FDAARGOS 1247]QRP64381.1 sigma-70 family RNA polymerase sigma factor [Rhodanobacter sp. FDAARGOS 1247]
MALRQDALYASYRRLERPLYNVLYRQLWQAEDCQDVIQDAYVRVWERRDKVDEATLDALVWTTALNLAKNRLRWRLPRRHAPLDEALLAPAADTQAPDFLAARQLHRALRKLPRSWQQVLLLSEFSGMRSTEIAAVLGIPAGTVASRKHLAMARLKTLMGAAADV